MLVVLAVVSSKVRISNVWAACVVAMAISPCALAQSAGMQEMDTGTLKAKLERVRQDGATTTASASADDSKAMMDRLGKIEEALRKLDSLAPAQTALKTEEPWRIESGKSLKDTLNDWANRAQYALAFEADDVVFPLSGQVSGNFGQALDQMQLYLCQAEVNVQIREYANRTVRVFNNPCPTGK